MNVSLWSFMVWLEVVLTLDFICTILFPDYSDKARVGFLLPNPSYSYTFHCEYIIFIPKIWCMINTSNFIRVVKDVFESVHLCLKSMHDDVYPQLLPIFMALANWLLSFLKLTIICCLLCVKGYYSWFFETSMLIWHPSTDC